MKISVFGAGYVGLVTAVGLAEIGNSVICMDVDSVKLDQLNSGNVAFYEPGLESMVQRNLLSKRLSFTTSSRTAIDFGDVLFVAVGTPPNIDGSADLSALFEVIQSIGSNMSQEKTIVIKSTVPVGTSTMIRDRLSAQLQLRNVFINFHVVSNPEFLKEGTAVNDFMNPDRIVVGADTTEGFEVMRDLIEPFQRRENILIEMEPTSAELTKYASNAMLATRISMMNEIASIAEHVGADIEAIRHGVGSDPRIGPSFLYAGCGYGGSCFQKDINALIYSAEALGLSPEVLKSVERVNEAQKSVLCDKVYSRFGDDLTDLSFAVWGLSFKPDTDDMRCAPSIPLIQKLTACGAKIYAYDPVATHNAQDVFGDIKGLVYHDNKYSALRGADALILVTEWKEFRSPDFEEIRQALNRPVIFDGRNQWDPSKMQSLKFEYYSIGRPAQLNWFTR